MSNETRKSGQDPANGGFEHSDISPAGVLYFIAGLAVVILLAHFAMDGLYSFLDRREKKHQPELNPLVTNVPTDTRTETNKDTLNFPTPRLEDDERTQLNDILRTQDETLYSYGWVDEKAGVVRIPIERAMELIAQRGLPVRAQQTPGQASAAGDDARKTGAKSNDVKKKGATP